MPTRLVILYLDEALRELEKTLSARFQTNDSYQQYVSAPGIHRHDYAKIFVPNWPAHIEQTDD